MVAAPILSTKLHAPQPRPEVLARPRLLRLLDEALQQGTRLALVSAPAGYGKTTLVSGWLRQANAPAAWLSLDEGDNDPVRFLQYTIAALRGVIPSLQIDAPDLLQGMQPLPVGALMGELINQAAAHTSPVVFILDDFHLIHAQPVLEMLTFLLDHLPPQMHLVLLSRTDPLLPLARLRSRDQLVDIRASQLRFAPDEIAIFLNTVMGLRLSGDDIAAMEARTEGWIAGLQLAALSMQGCADPHGFIAAFTGSNRYIMDYLAEEVLKLQTPAVRSFLLQTPILSRMCGELCSAVVETDASEPVDGQAMLETLEQMNLFLVPLDSERRWYRYHHLFADVLNRRLERDAPQRLSDRHRRASQWFEQNGMIDEAIRHALLAGDRDRATHLVEDNGCLLLMAGEVVTLLQRIDAVAADLAVHPWLAVLKAWALALTGRLELLEPLLQPAERIIAGLAPTPDTTTVLGAIAGARAYRAMLQTETGAAVAHAQQALDYLPDTNDLACSLRGVATSILGDASWMNGQLNDARSAYLEAARIGQAAHNGSVVIIANSGLGDVLLEQGLLHQAARTYTDILRMTTRPDGRRVPLAARVLAGLSRVSYEWNQIETASQHAQACIELCRDWGQSDHQAVAYLVLAGVARALGDAQRAQEALHLAEQLVSEHLVPGQQPGWVQGALVRLRIAYGEMETATQALQQSASAASPRREDKDIALLRVLVARGDEAALALAGSLLSRAEDAGRMGRVIEILILQALALQAHTETPQALAVVERAISLAQTEGFVRVFLDEGEPMRMLIGGLRLSMEKRAVHCAPRGYVDKLQAAFAQPEAVPQLQISNQRSAMAETLSRRELEVLHLIGAGLSNHDIAARLVISVATVKRHISTIYAKLGVASRTQALSRSRELKILD